MQHDDQHPKHKHVKSDVLRGLLIVIGWISIAGGIIGLFLPLVPTVPFLLLGALCFSRSSIRFHTWLVEHKHFGPMLRGYLMHGSVPMKAKVVALGMVWISFPASTFLFAEALWLKLLLISLAAAITLYLLYLPTASPAPKSGETKPEP